MELWPTELQSDCSNPMEIKCVAYIFWIMFIPTSSFQTSNNNGNTQLPLSNLKPERYTHIVLHVERSYSDAEIKAQQSGYMTRTEFPIRSNLVRETESETRNEAIDVGVSENRGLHTGESQERRRHVTESDVRRLRAEIKQCLHSQEFKATGVEAEKMNMEIKTFISAISED